MCIRDRRQGQAYLEEALGKLEGDVLSGEEAFTLHDTYGLSLIHILPATPRCSRTKR